MKKLLSPIFQLRNKIRECTNRKGSSKFSPTERLVAIGLGILAVFSPLYIDQEVTDPELDDQIVDHAYLLPFLLLILMLAIALSHYMDHSFTRLDPYLIYRVCGSSGGIIVILIVIALVLNCKTK